MVLHKDSFCSNTGFRMIKLSYFVSWHLIDSKHISTLSPTPPPMYSTNQSLYQKLHNSIAIRPLHLDWWGETDNKKKARWAICTKSDELDTQRVRGGWPSTWLLGCCFDQIEIEEEVLILETWKFEERSVSQSGQMSDLKANIHIFPILRVIN